jgi:hypothetical protein
VVGDHRLIHATVPLTYVSEETTMASGGVTQIDAEYLKSLREQLEHLKTDVEYQITGLGSNEADPYLTWPYIPPVDNGSLNLMPGSDSFDAGGKLKAAYKAAGGSVHDRLVWLDNTLTDMISEIDNTIHKFNGTENLNNDTIDQLNTYFPHTIGDFGNSGGSPGPNMPNPNTSGQ